MNVSDIPDIPVQVPIDNPDADTEWNDILRKHGIIPEKPKDMEPAIQEALLEAEQRKHDNRLEGKDLDELDALEDDEDEEFLNHYRMKRIAEMNALASKAKFGSVYPLQKVDFTREVTEASQGAFVCVALTSASDSNVESQVLTEIWRQAATKFGDVKFCSIKGNMCIEGYPERNCPTILIYHKGDIAKQLVTLMLLKGVRTRLEDIEHLLVEVHAVNEGDLRLRNKDEEDAPMAKTNGISDSKINHATVDDDDGWD